MKTKILSVLLACLMVLSVMPFAAFAEESDECPLLGKTHNLDNCPDAKKLDVIKVKTFAEYQCITRELMLIKIKYNKNNRREIMELCEIMNAQIVDMSKHFMMIQICDTPERVKLMIDMLQSISIVEVARTGTLALSKCTENDKGK